MMPLAAGDKLGPYEILALIGKGGMGEVYRAHDPRLRRDVAIKVSAAQFTERFEREARAVAALNHPNICTLYDIGPNYLVMEYVEGAPPAGPLPLEEALRIARQIVDALEAAHEKGVTHRDLKPANIMIRPDGTLKVLDFGLAKIAEPQQPQGPDAPTLTIGMTGVGAILGTPAYMAPEQARGKEADKRSDIWSFGVVFYELLTGNRLFQGEDLTETLAWVVTKEPELTAVPVEVRRLLAKCLQKDPRKRLRDIGDVWELMEGGLQPAQPLRPVSAWPSRWLWIAATALLLLLAPANLLHWRETPPKAQLMRFEIPAPEKTNFTNQPVISPDGKMVAFTAVGADGRSLLWVRSLDALAARSLPGTEGAQSPVFWSPDSRSLAYSGSSIRKLMRVEVAGGPPVTVNANAGANGAPYGAWGTEGVILFKVNNVLHRVSAAGGESQPVTALDSKRGDSRHSAPAFLPDGKHFLYLVGGNPEHAGIYIGSIDASPDKQENSRLLPTDGGAVYTPSAADPKKGYLLFRRENALMAQPFDPEGRVLAGDAAPIAEQVGGNPEIGNFSASAAGILAYRTANNGGTTQTTWYDRSGKSLGPITEVGTYISLAISPDGERVALQKNDSGNGTGASDIWLREFARGTTDRLTFDPAVDWAPVWSPSGDRVVYASQRDGVENLYWKVSSNAGDDQPLLKSDAAKLPLSWSRDGRFLLYSVRSTKTRDDLWVLPMDGKEGAKAEGKVFLETPAFESQGQFSPDSHFIAYTSDATGASQIYVRPFSPDGNATGQWMVSVGGGIMPRWSRDGKELFFISADSKLMSVPVNITGGTFRPGAPQELFPVPIVGGAGINRGHRWDVAPDGKKFLFNVTAAATSSAPIMVVVNWQESLKK